MISFDNGPLLAHFGLRTRPFDLPPDPAVFFPAPGHLRAQAVLDHGLATRAPVTLLTGDPGTGKSLLVREAVARASADLSVAVLATAAPRGRCELFELILVALGVPLPDPAGGARFAALYAALEERLVAEYARGRRVLLVCDEAHALDDACLAQLRRLLNINFGGHDLLELVLVGETDLRKRLGRPAHTSLAQLVSAHAHLPALTEDDLPGYIDHRLRAAGAGRAIFEQSTAAPLLAASGGIPRLVNQLCAHALLYAFGAGADHVTRKTVEAVIADGVVLGAACPRPSPTPARALG
ncbi:MAG: AAA family ATPase [Pseudomonadota bacterium]